MMWLTSIQRFLEPDALVTRAKELGYDLNVERIAIIFIYSLSLRTWSTHRVATSIENPAEF